MTELPEDASQPGPSDDVADTTGASQRQALHSALVARDAMAERVRRLEETIAATRGAPLRSLLDMVEFRVLAALSRMTPPLPERTAVRFARSAMKRDPARSLRSHDEGDPTPSSARGGFSTAGALPHDPAKPDVLIVSHDASRSGAPILALNLAEQLLSRYNVTTLLVRGGECIDAFHACSVRVYRADGLTPGHLDGLVAGMCADRTFDFALVNSGESYGALSGLRRAGVATVCLLHEFACLFQVPTAMDRILRDADEIVFSAQVTLGNACDEYPAARSVRARVIPQGKCRVPARPSDPGAGLAEQAMLRATLRPDGAKDDTFVVLGAGTVSIRKGVDLFIETAARVLHSPGGERARFFWIGSRYDPAGDFTYSVYIRDQMRRAGIEDRMTMIRETSEIEAAYAMADLFLLPSRLDPLPNVGIDAMSLGLPVVCFDRATGLAEQLGAAGVAGACIARYLDTRDMADKVLAFVNTPQLRADVSARVRTHAEQAFDFAAYARQIEDLAVQATARVRGGAATVPS